MSRLPILSIISQAFAVLAAYPGKLLLWALGPFCLSLVAAAIGATFFVLSGKWWTGVPFGVLALFFWMPFLIRVNQLAVLGRVEPGGYFEKIFDPQSVRCFRYLLITSSIYIAGMAMAAAPAVVLGLRQGFDPITQMLSLAVIVGVVLFLAFLVLFAPLNLIFPAVGVEASPGLSRAYTLGAGNKLRLFAAMFIVQALFVVLGALVDGIGGVFGGSDKMPQLLLLYPMHAVLAFSSNVLNLLIPAVSYRFFRNMPDPLASAPLRPAPAPLSPVEPRAEDASAAPDAKGPAEVPKESTPSAPDER